MEYTGLIQRHKLNRPLSDEERELQLRQRQRLEVEPHYHLATIKLNGTFLESADKYYGWKGFLSVVMIVVSALCAWMFGMGAWVVVVDAPAQTASRQSEAIAAGVFLMALFLPLLSVTVWLLFKDAFRYTHYPIRLNRKNRMLYVFRLDGTVLSVPWEEVFFTLGRGNRSFGVQNWDIRAHVLDADGKTVRETFALGMEWEVQDHLRCHWEYVRRYMEEGPQAVIRYTPVYLPISDRRETFVFGLLRLIANIPGRPFAQLILLPFFFASALGRSFAMHTSKIPVWPQEVEAACRIEPGDPYERDARHNPPDFWKHT